MLITERMDHIKFSHSEQIIVDYLKREQLNIENKSTSDIAQETFSSKSTIVKVAKAPSTSTVGATSRKHTSMS